MKNGSNGPGRKRVMLAAAVVIAASLVAALFLFVSSARAATALGAPGPVKVSGRSAQVPPGAPSVGRTVQAGGATWTVTSYPSSEGPCVVANGALMFAPGGGSVGGCGRPDGPFRVSIGGLALGGRWYQVAFGVAPAGTTQVRVVLRTGRTLVDAAPVRGLWIVVSVVRLGDPGADMVRVEALDANGRLLARIEPAGSSDYVRQVDAQPAADTR